MLLKKAILNYFTFTKKERRGLFILLTILAILISISIYLQSNSTYFNYGNIDMKEQLDLLKVKQVTQKQTNHRFQKQDWEDDQQFQFKDYSAYIKSFDRNFKGNLFYFDPNTLSAEGWKKLGVSEKTTQTIQNYIEKGGQFKTPEDIGKIYGLTDEMVERLIPYVSIKPSYHNNSNTDYSTKDENTNQNFQPTYEYKRTEDFLANYKIDINTADTNAWKKLPGIGSRLSYRIVNYKNKLGGFYNVQQVAETFGLPDSTFQKIKSNLVCNPSEIIKININTVTAENFYHPYINKSLINNILQYRQQHGNYKSLQDLNKLALMNEAIFQKITPYLTVN